MNPLTNIMGTVEAARLWGYEESSVKKMCQQGKLKAVRIGKTWVLDKNQPNPKQ